MDTFLVLTQEPFIRFMPNDVREWLQIHTSEHELAVAFAHVSNQTTRLMCACQGVEDYWIDYTFEEWNELRIELENEILSVLKSRNEPQTSVRGSHYIFVPFMAKHGYRDGHGWWVPCERS